MASLVAFGEKTFYSEAEQREWEYLNAVTEEDGTYYVSCFNLTCGRYVPFLDDGPFTTPHRAVALDFFDSIMKVRA